MALETRYPGAHDDCIATTPHFHARPYRAGDWAAHPDADARNVVETLLMDFQFGMLLSEGRQPLGELDLLRANAEQFVRTHEAGVSARIAEIRETDR